MAQLASDVDNTQFVGAIDPDSVMYAEFYLKPILQVFESEKAGREIWKDVLYCRYGCSGNTLSQQDVPAYDWHKQRFHKFWMLYQNAHGEDSKLAGTPVTQWPILSPADAENLRSAKFYTVENVAGASDLQLQSLGMGVAGMAPYILRAKAQAFLGIAKDTALPQKQAADIEELRKQVADLTALLTAQKEAPKAKKGRKEWTPEQKEAARARMKKAREAKKQKAE